MNLKALFLAGEQEHGMSSGTSLIRSRSHELNAPHSIFAIIFMQIKYFSEDNGIR